MEEIWKSIEKFFVSFTADAALKLLGALVMLLAGLKLIRLLMALLSRSMEKSKLDRGLLGFVTNLLSFVLRFTLVVSLLIYLGVPATSFIAILSSAGLAIGLALQGSLANFAAGFLLIIFKPFKAGDYIEGAGVAGTVEGIQVFTTVLRTADNKTIIVPNAKIMGDNITNYSAKETRRVDLLFGVSYSDDIDKVRRILQNIVDSDPRILKDPESMIIVKELAESRVNLEVRAWVKTGDYWGVYFDTLEKAKRKFDAAGVSIPFPQRGIHVYEHRQGQTRPRAALGTEEAETGLAESM